MLRNMCCIENPRARAAREYAEAQQRRFENTQRPQTQQQILDQIQQMNRGNRDVPPTYDEAVRALRSATIPDNHEPPPPTNPNVQ